MNKSFYVSGFLYHPDSRQILLQRCHSDDSTWSLFAGKNKSGETSTESFKRHIRTLLNVNLKESAIHTVYNYMEADDNNFVSYAEVKELAQFPKNSDAEFAWFTLKEISKLNLTSQTKQNITVGQRVIDSSIRRKAGAQTID